MADRPDQGFQRQEASEIGERAFAEWLSSQPAGKKTEKTDRNAELIAGTLWSLVQQGKSAIPRGGYPVGRGRGRVIVEPAKP